MNVLAQLGRLSLGSSLARAVQQPWLQTQVRPFWKLVDPNPTSPDNTGSRIPQKSIEKKDWFNRNPNPNDPFDSRQEMYKNGYGVVLYNLHDGERKSLAAVVGRFKRLDWGAWIRPRAGRDKKKWKKNSTQLVNNEKHVFCKKYHKKRFDRAVTHEIKEIRHFPEDPYKVYNEMSWQNYSSIKSKNMELIRTIGAPNYDFPHHVAHFSKVSKPGDKKRHYAYEPPGYHRDIASGVYRPELSRPQNITPPDYRLVERHHSTVANRYERKYWRRLRQLEQFTRVPLTSKLRLPMAGTFTQ